MKHAVPNTNVDKGVCFYDQTHVFKINGLVTLPFDECALVKGWQISGILAANSGLPMNIQDGYDEAAGGTLVASTPRPDYVPGCQVQVGSGTTHSVSLLRRPARSVTWGEARFEAPGFSTSISRCGRIPESRKPLPFSSGPSFQYLQSHQSGAAGDRHRRRQLVRGRRWAKRSGRTDPDFLRAPAPDPVARSSLQLKSLF